MIPKGAVVEIIERTARGERTDSVIVANAVLVNGHDMGLIASGGVEVGYGPDDAVVVTLRLMPSEVHIMAKADEQVPG